MSPPTTTSPISSISSAPPSILRPSRSRLLTVWWLALHALLLATAVALGVPPLAKLGLAAACVAHALWRRPRAAGTLVLGADGRFGLPDSGLGALELARGSGLGPFSIRLVLTDGRRRFDVLLVRDQLGDAEWRLLRAHLKRTFVRI